MILLSNGRGLTGVVLGVVGLEDAGLEDDGLEDDGLEDDGLEDDGLEDDGLVSLCSICSCFIGRRVFCGSWSSSV